ncbi:MAG: hypothetical protein GEU94_02185 [Micromonosporaceae bacterium]|nr:hypothetical protein [Micromonosporaceae bacterium]
MARLSLREFEKVLGDVRQTPVGAGYVQRLEEQYNAYAEDWKGRLRKNYEAASARYSRDASELSEVLPLLRERAAEIRSDLEGGRISFAEAKKQVFETRRDLEGAREQLAKLAREEEQTWALVEAGPGAYQEFLQRRSPAAFRNGFPNFDIPHLNNQIGV